MALINKRRLTGLISASAIIATLTVAAVPAATLAAAAPSTKYFNGFENASNTAEAKAVFEVTRIDERTSSIDAAAGRWYVTAAPGSEVFTRLGGYSSTFPTRGYSTSADFYLDVASVGQFEWSSAINGTDGAHRRDFIFHVGRGTEGPFQVSVSNNSRRDAADGFEPTTITESGWYTFKHEFIKSDDGTLAVRMSVTKKGVSTPLETWTLSDPSDFIGQTVGGNRYGWLVTNSFASLALDNVTRVAN